MFNATVITLYPEAFPTTLGVSVAGRALQNGKWSLDTINIRDFAIGKHKQVDDTPYGGGAGMVMRPDVIGAAIEHAAKQQPNNKLVHLTPRGTIFNQEIAQQLAQEKGLTIICGRFEAIDERVIEKYQPLELSIGDYILFGGEVAAQVILEAVLRNIPDIIGNSDTHNEESFNFGKENALLLEYPHYTRPPLWEGKKVPDILLSGHHKEVERWRKREAEKVTKKRRPDIWKKYQAKSLQNGERND